MDEIIEKSRTVAKGRSQSWLETPEEMHKAVLHYKSYIQLLIKI